MRELFLKKLNCRKIIFKTNSTILDFPILQALKEHGTHFNANQFISLHPDSDFGNLNLVWMEIVVRIDCVNDLIILTYKDFYILKEQAKHSGMIHPNQHHRQKMHIEQIIYWLRKTTDELISLIDILSVFKAEGMYPKKIKISSIGEFLNCKNPFNGDLNSFRPLLQQLNEISNGFKHSFINSQIHAYHATEYPVVFAYTLPYNDRSKSPKFHTLDLKQVLNDYNTFLEFTKKYIKNNFEYKKVEKLL